MNAKIIRFLILGLAIVLFLFVMTNLAFEAKEKERRAAPVFAPTKIREITLTIEPGKQVVFSTRDPVTGDPCTFTPVWKVYSEDSELMNSVHGFMGEDGMGDLIKSSYKVPTRRNGLLMGEELNNNVYFSCLHNTGPDVVVLVVKFWGSRQVSAVPLPST